MNIRQSPLLFYTHELWGRQWRRLASELINLNTRHGDWSGRASHKFGLVVKLNAITLSCLHKATFSTFLNFMNIILFQFKFSHKVRTSHPNDLWPSIVQSMDVWPLTQLSSRTYLTSDPDCSDCTAHACRVLCDTHVRSIITFHCWVNDQSAASVPASRCYWQPHNQPITAHSQQTGTRCACVQVRALTNCQWFRFFWTLQKSANIYISLQAIYQKM